jgi:hypothetical protein
MRKNLLLLFLSLALTVSLAELVMRKVGYVPGQLRFSPWLRMVDQLHPLQGFVSDGHGIFKIDTTVSRQIELARSIAPRPLVKIWCDYEKEQMVAELPLIYFDHLEFPEHRAANNELSERFVQLKRKGPLSKFDSLLIHYQHFPVNKDGFYSIPFDALAPDRTKVLLLGDSFTWGHSSKNKTGSFANTLLARDLLVYNTGISGADMPQYMRILETYFDSIDPDIVILNFYVGNDVSYYSRIPESGLPIHFNTNAGNLMAFQDGVQFHDAQSAYDNILRNSFIPQTSSVNRMLSETVIGTLIWKALVRLCIIEHKYFIPPPRPEIPICNKEMEQIRSFCEARNKRFILSVIPYLVDNKLESVEWASHLFEGMAHHEPAVTLDMYDQKDGHFNEKGHLFYANYLEKLILAETEVN